MSNISHTIANLKDIRNNWQSLLLLEESKNMSESIGIKPLFPRENKRKRKAN